MANQILSLSDENTRKVRKLLTRKPDGSFAVCDTHERRIRAESFEILISADSETGAVNVQAVASLTCGHSKKPCTETKRVVLADETNGVNPEIVKGLKLVTADENEKGEGQNAA